jgi:hypothetical protein
MASNSSSNLIDRWIGIFILIAVIVALVPTMLIFLGNLTSAMSGTALAVLFSSGILTLVFAYMVWRYISAHFLGKGGGRY